MKRRTLGIFLAGLAFVAIARAMIVVYTGPLANETALAYNKNYDLDANTNHIDYVSAQAVYAKAAPAAVSFTDGHVSTATITVSSNAAAGFGQPTIIAINGTTLISGRDWNWTATSSMTAKSISDAIVANTTLQAIVTSSYTIGGVVYATSTAVGSAVNYTLTASTPALSVAGFSAGLNSDINTTSYYLTKANAFTTALAVLYTKTAGTNPGTLVVGTTYYVIPVTSGTSFKLATSTTNAVAGTSVAITTQTTTGGGTFTLTPLAYAGTPGLVWYSSNDGTNYSALSVSSVTYTGASTTPSTTVWDFSNYDYRYLRLAATAPTAGGFQVTVTINGKSTGH